MATYKVPQDVEAEDKIVGFLSLKQLIFVIVMFASLYMAYLLGRANIFLGLLPLPIAFISGMLGLYQRKDQPVEIFFASWLRFKTKPLKRKWDQEGFEERVIITVPNHATKNYTNNLSQDQVSSRLDQLSALMDSRGWASKHGAVSMQQSAAMPQQMNQPVFTNQLQDEERLLSNDELRSFAKPASMLDADSHVTDIYDATASTNRTAQEVGKDMKQLDDHRMDNAKRLIDKARSEAPALEAPKNIATLKLKQQPTTTKPAHQQTTVNPEKSNGPEISESDDGVTIDLHSSHKK
jgi:hypothetical protein